MLPCAATCLSSSETYLSSSQCNLDPNIEEEIIEPDSCESHKTPSDASYKQEIAKMMEKMDSQQTKLLKELHTLHVDILSHLQAACLQQYCREDWSPPEAVQSTRLRVTVVGAQGFLHASQTCPPDVYCTCWLSGKPGTDWRTSSAQGLRETCWQEEHDVQNFVWGDTLEFCVTCSGRLLGHGILSSVWFYQHGFDGEIPLYGVGQSKTAQLHVRVALINVANSSQNDELETFSSLRSISAQIFDNPIERSTSATHAGLDGSQGFVGFSSDFKESGEKTRKLERNLSSKSAHSVGQSLNHVYKYGELDRVLQGHRNYVAQIIKGQHFEICCGIIIFANSIYMGVVSDSDVRSAISGSGHGSPIANSLLRDSCEMFFYSFYLIEVVLKLFALNRQFFCGEGWQWNLFDLLLVIVGSSDVVSIFAKSSSTPKLIWLRQLRLFKLIKMFRVVKMMRIFKELRVILNAVFGASRSFFWVLSTLVMITFMFSLVFIQGITSFYEDMGKDEMPKDVHENAEAFFGSLATGMFTLYQTVSGGMPWRQVALTIQAAGNMYFVCFLFYIAFLVFAVLRLLTGIFVQHASEVVELDREAVIKESILKRHAWQMEIKAIFLNIDDDGNGTISWEEFRDNFTCEAIHAYFSALGIETADPWTTFRILDTDCDGKICLNDFMSGCSRLRGHAKNIDVMKILSDVTAINNRLGLIEKGIINFVTKPPQSQHSRLR